MLAMLAGLLKPSQGQIVIAGKDIGTSEGKRTKFRGRYIGFAFQGANNLTAQENVELLLPAQRQVQPSGTPADARSAGALG